MRIVKVILITLVACVLLGACGLKGPLYLPDAEPVANPTADQGAEPDSNDPDEERESDSD